MNQEEIPLVGGNVSVVVRVGDSVRRTASPWTATVQHFLRYLRSRRFYGVPRPMGFDEQGREALSYIEGEVGHYPLADYMWSARTLGMAARMMRRYHDLSIDYVPPADAQWQYTYPNRSQHEVICHNDFAPYNMVFYGEKPKALIDWDIAGPGPRIWDVAYAVYRFVPLSWEEDLEEDLAELRPNLVNPVVQSMRLRYFCDAYGLEDRSELLDMVRARLEHLCEHMTDRAAEGNSAFQAMVDEGHWDLYQRDIAALESHRSQLRF
ncbi:MAG: phosphotransferase [Chloroflexia bacterium]